MLHTCLAINTPYYHSMLKHWNAARARARGERITPPQYHLANNWFTQDDHGQPQQADTDVHCRTATTYGRTHISRMVQRAHAKR